MDATRSFEQAWPELDRRLRTALAGRRVPADLRDDIVQETGLRLFRAWAKVRADSMWSFTLTIAINLVRDEMRRRQRQDPSRLEAPVLQRDAEHEAMIRIELQRVSDAMACMSERQRSILLTEIGLEAHGEAEGSALKMARMRARRRLRSMLEQASGFVLVGLDRLRRTAVGGDAAWAGAVTSMGRPLAVASVATMGVMGMLTPDMSDLFDGGLTRGPVVVLGSDAPVRDAGDIPRARTIIQLAARAELDPAEDSSANERFGPVTSSEDGVLIDPDESSFGPYEAEQEIAPSTFGENGTRAAVRARHEGAECGGSGATSMCTGTGRATVTVEVSAAGEERTVTIGSARVASNGGARKK